MIRLQALFLGFLCAGCLVINKNSATSNNSVSKVNLTQFAFRYFLDVKVGINPIISYEDSMEVASDFQKNQNIYKIFYYKNDSTMSYIELVLPAHKTLDSIHDSTLLTIAIDGTILAKESRVGAVRLKYQYKEMPSLSEPDSVKYLLVESKYEFGFSHSIFIPKILLDSNLELLGFVLYDGLESKTYIYLPQNTYDIFYLLR